MNSLEVTAKDLLTFTNGKKYNTIYADPPWQFQNRTGKVAPEHKRLTRYKTMSLADIKALPIPAIADNKAHLYLWIPNALLPEGLDVIGDLNIKGMLFGKRSVKTVCLMGEAWVFIFAMSLSSFFLV